MTKLSDFMKQREEKKNGGNGGGKLIENLGFTNPKGSEKVTIKVRVLPDIVNGKPEKDDVFWREVRTHKGFYNKIEKKQELFLRCPTMFDLPCPICTVEGGQKKSLLSKFWDAQEILNSKGDTKNTLYNNVKAYKTNVMNVYVIENTGNKDQEGKVVRMYPSKAVLDSILAAIYDEDEPRDVLDWKKGCIVKFVISENPDNGYNKWNVSVLGKKHDLSEVEVAEVPTLTTLIDGYKERTPEYEEWNNKFVEIFEKHKPAGINLGAPAESTSEQKEEAADPAEQFGAMIDNL